MNIEKSLPLFSAESIRPCDDPSFEQRSHRLIHYLPLGVVVLDMDLTITDSNPAARKILLSAQNAAETLMLGTKLSGSVIWK